MVSRAFLIVLMTLGLVACAASPTQPGADVGDVEDAEQAEKAPEVVPEKTPAAVALPQRDPGLQTASASLLDQARAARMNGELARADALLQRAQRLDPGNGLVYLELAKLYLQRGQDDSARAVAERGLLYCDVTSCDELRALARP